jgi:hypothetical protein
MVNILIIKKKKGNLYLTDLSLKYFKTKYTNGEDGKKIKKLKKKSKFFRNKRNET